MPRYDRGSEPSKREQRLNEYQQFQALGQRQQALDQSANSDVMQQLMQLYGLQQQQQMDPLRMQEAQAGIQAKNFENQNAQRVLDSRLTADAAQAQYYGNREQQPELPRGFEYLPPDAQEVAMNRVYPELAQKRAGEVKQKQAVQSAAVAQDISREGIVPGMEEFYAKLGFTPEQLTKLARNAKAEQYIQKLGKDKRNFQSDFSD